MTASQLAPFIWHSQVPRLGTGQEFAALRRLLEESDYSDEGLCRRLGVADLDKYSAPPAPELIARPVSDALDALMRLFYHSVFAEEAAVARALPEGAFALLESLGLVARAGGMVYGASAILPAAGMLTVCDRGNHGPDGVYCKLPADVVYPAIFDTTRRFLACLPDTPCEALLDIGTGTGIAAMLGARHARRVWATDITERSALFAEFNRRLYGLENMTVVQGDLFAPVEGLTFDRIVIHPPYVPAKESKLVFRDAGEDGEQIIRRTVEELPRFLRPGGRFYSLQMATDREDEPLEDRVRKWLGARHAEFDIVTAARSVQSPTEFVSQLLFAGRMDPAHIPGLIETWNKTRTVALVYASLLIERGSGGRQPVTRRAMAGRGYAATDLEWLLDWEKRLKKPETIEFILDSRPALAPESEVRITHRMEDGRLAEREFSFQAWRPFQSRCDCDAGLAQVLMACDGSRSCRHLYENAHCAGHIPESASASDFAALMGAFIADGVLRIPE